MAKKHSIGQLLRRALLLKCPDCGYGSLYRRLYHLNHHCEYCGLIFEREQGYFVGAIYINVLATNALIIATLVGYMLITGTVSETILWVLFGIGIGFPLLFFRHSRSFWINFDHFFDPLKDRVDLDEDPFGANF
jgi:uncharacterized protein (DUF983 family)